MDVSRLLGLEFERENGVFMADLLKKDTQIGVFGHVEDELPVIV